LFFILSLLLVRGRKMRIAGNFIHVSGGLSIEGVLLAGPVYYIVAILYQFCLLKATYCRRPGKTGTHEAAEPVGPGRAKYFTQCLEGGGVRSLRPAAPTTLSGVLEEICLSCVNGVDDITWFFEKPVLKSAIF
jgi:hypothetical protein